MLLPGHYCPHSAHQSGAADRSDPVYGRAISKLTVTGGVKCWGDNHNGQLGDGSVNARVTPLDVAGLTSNISAIAAGKQHSCALEISGTVRCWGDNRHREVGEESESEKVRPVELTALKNTARAIAAGGEHTCALTLDKVHCWGSNVYGQIGKKT